jgi:NTP pyrophosphatase (non-canonical NTP hydrolase)
VKPKEAQTMSTQQAQNVFYSTHVQSESGRNHLSANVGMLSEICHGVAAESGWWTDPKTGESLKGKRNVPEMLCLIHSEISEAMEGHRKNLNDDKLPHRKMIEVELADAMIRILDLAGGLGLDLGGALAEKLAYNTQRADHKLENRAKEDGKAY